MKKLFIIAFIFLLAFSFSSCKKEEKNAPGTGPSKHEILTGEVWKMTGLTNDSKDVFSTMDVCQKDNIFTFLADMWAMEDEGATKCVSTHPQTIRGKWEFASSETQFIWNSKTYNIKELTSVTFKIERIESGVTIVITFTAQ